MDTVLGLKNTCDDFSVEFDVMTPFDLSSMDERERRITEGLSEVDARLAITESKIQEINKNIDKLTNHADGLDYTIAVASGIVAGLIDSLWVGECSLYDANKDGDDAANKFVIMVAKSQGYKGDDLEGAIKFLEGKYGLASDSVTSKFGGGKQHHLRDFAHHPTPVGLMFSLLTQFTKKAYGTDEHGMFLIVDVENKAYIGNNVGEKLLYGVVYWVFHMVSDMAGSSSAAGGGTGLPGPLVSLLKELSVLPFFRNIKIDDKSFSEWISKLFNGTLLAKRDENGNITDKEKFDLRTELGAMKQLGKQAIPVIINECIVRGFYFVRHFMLEIKANNVKEFRDLKKINIDNVLPVKNRTVVRMLTIATGTFTAIDVADAAIRSAVKSGGVTNPAFLGNMILRVNFVGVGRFAIAVGTDVKMGVQRSKLINERMHIYTEQIALANAKVFYKQADMWIAADNAGEAIEKAYSMMEKTTQFYIESHKEIRENLDKIGNYLPEAEKKNPGLMKDIEDILKWE